MVELFKFIFSKWYIFFGTLILLTPICHAIGNLIRINIYNGNKENNKGESND